MRLLDAFNFFLNPAWLANTFFTLWGGGGDGATSTTYTSNVPPGLEGEYKNLYNMAQQSIFNIDKNGNITGFKPYVPYSGNPADYVAGFSPMQQQAFTGAANMQVSPWYGQGADLAKSAGLGGLESALRAYGYGNQGFQSGQLGQKLGVEGGGYYGNLGAQIGQMGLNAQDVGRDITGLSRELAGRQAQAGTDYYGMATNPYVQQQFMSPYMQNVIDLQKAAANRDFEVQNQVRQAQAARSGAFGGSRQAIEQAEANKALNAQLQNIEAQGLQNAYDKAIQSMQYGAGLNLQGLGGAQSGLGTALQGGQLGLQGLGTALQGVQTGLQGVGTQMQGTGQGMQGAGVGLQGISGAQAGYGLANQAANTLGNLATLQGTQAMDILGLQNQMGTQQQQQQQNITNQAIQNYSTAQQWPMMQLQYLANLLRGGQGQAMTTQGYAAQPNMMAQVAGLAPVAYGMSQLGKAEGGIVKLAKGGAVQGYAGGGDVMSQDNVERIAEKLSIPQLQQAMQNKTVDEYIGIPLLAQKQQEQQRMQLAQAAMQAQQGQQPTIKDALMAQIGQAEPAGIDTLSSNLPVAQGAEGGIVAFAGGGDVSEADIAYGNALDQSFVKTVPRAGMAFMSDLLGLPGQIVWKRDPVTGELYRDYEREGWMPRSANYEKNEAARREKGEKLYDTVKAQQEQQKRTSQQTGQRAEQQLMAATAPEAQAPKKDPIFPFKPASMIAEDNAAKIRRDLEAGVYGQSPAPAPAPSGGPGVGGFMGQIDKRLAGIEKLAADIEKPGPYQSQLEGALGKYKERAEKPEMTIEQAMAETKKYGPQGKAYEDYENLIKTDIDKLNQKEKNVTAKSFIKMGIGMIAAAQPKAGQPTPTFLSVLAEGANLGIEYDDTQMKEIEKARQLHQRAMADINQARRAEEREDFKTARTLQQRSEDMRIKAEEKQIDIYNSLNNDQKDRVLKATQIKAEGILKGVTELGALGTAATYANRKSADERLLDIAMQDPSMYKSVKGPDGRPREVFDVEKFSTSKYAGRGTGAGLAGITERELRDAFQDYNQGKYMMAGAKPGMNFWQFKEWYNTGTAGAGGGTDYSQWKLK